MSVATWTYTGERLLSSGKLVNSWIIPGDDDDAIVDFKVKAPVGTQYSVETTDEGKYRLGKVCGYIREAMKS